MECPRCDSGLPHGAAFCHVCGADVLQGVGSRNSRRHAFAAHPGQSVYRLDLVTSLMPLASQRAPRTYRLALLVALLVPTACVVLGQLPAAFVAAALVVPVVYVVYLRDVNEWEDEPLPVVLGAIVASGVFAMVFTLLAEELMPHLSLRQLASGEWYPSAMLVSCLLVPVGGELLRQIGPALLARRPQYDDMIDGVTFAVASGAAWAAVETIVSNRHMITGPSDLGGSDVVLWWLLLLNAGLVKPIVLGSATAIAMARFSGIGPGYVGVGRQYLGGLLEAMVYGVVFQLGLYSGDRIGGQSGALVSLAVSLLVAAVVLVRVRLLLHHALLEAAVESARAAIGAKHAVVGEGYCGQCDMPLLPGAGFCSACGTATRAVSKLRRTFNADAGASISSSSSSTEEVPS